MAKCELTGRKRSVGRSIKRRGIAKKKKGIGLNITGKSKRVFGVNVHAKKVWLEDGRFIKMKLSAAALRTLRRKGTTNTIKKLIKKTGS